MTRILPYNAEGQDDANCGTDDGADKVVKKNRRMKVVKPCGDKDDSVNEGGNGRGVAKVKLMIIMKLIVMKKTNRSTFS